MKLLIVGCGYVGLEVVTQLRDAHSDEISIYALTRSAERIQELSARGVTPCIGNWLDPSTLTDLPEVDYVLVSVPHRADEQIQESTHVSGLENLLAALREGWQKLVYLSTTGVYGSLEGNVVNEDTPMSPTRIGPQIAVEAEKWLSSKLNSTQCTVLRLAGIYGPGRIPLASKLQAGEALKVPQEGHVNLVHVSDIAKMIIVVMRKQLGRMAYVFSDGNPVQRREFYSCLAQLCGVEHPRFEPPDPTASRARRATDKRVSPRNLLDETGFSYSYPSYREGLPHAIEDQS